MESNTKDQVDKDHVELGARVYLYHVYRKQQVLGNQFVVSKHVGVF